jgi:hypothetical protein
MQERKTGAIADCFSQQSRVPELCAWYSQLGVEKSKMSNQCGQQNKFVVVSATERG